MAEFIVGLLPHPLPLHSLDCQVAARTPSRRSGNFADLGREGGGEGKQAKGPPATRPPHEKTRQNNRKANRQEAHASTAPKRKKLLLQPTQHALVVLVIGVSNSYSLWGSNPRPMAHKTIALTTELRELWVH